jgi:hypothetical protein
VTSAVDQRLSLLRQSIIRKKVRADPARGQTRIKDIMKKDLPLGEHFLSDLSLVSNTEISKHVLEKGQQSMDQTRSFSL